MNRAARRSSRELGSRVRSHLIGRKRYIRHDRVENLAENDAIEKQIEVPEWLSGRLIGHRHRVKHEQAANRLPDMGFLIRLAFDPQIPMVASFGRLFSPCTIPQMVSR